MAENLPDERSPVFLQFLDVLYQLLVQFPNAFEFTDTLLLFLADHLNSCLFGNFLGKFFCICFVCSMVDFCSLFMVVN